MKTTPLPNTTFRGVVIINPHPFCPVCGEPLRTDAWTSLEHFAICPQYVCCTGKHWRPALNFILANIDRIPIVHAYGLHWYTPKYPHSDELACFRATLNAKETLANTGWKESKT